MVNTRNNRKAGNTTPTIDLPHKHVQNEANPTSELQPASKNIKAGTAGTQQPPHLQRKIRSMANVTPRDPLPDRTGRNVHPVPKKPTRRSHHQIEAEQDMKRKAIEEKIRELEEAKYRLAEINVYEDIEDNKMDRYNSQRLSAAIQKRQHAEVEGDTTDNNETFDFMDIDEMSDSSHSEEPGKKIKVSVYHG